MKYQVWIMSNGYIQSKKLGRLSSLAAAKKRAESIPNFKSLIKDLSEDTTSFLIEGTDGTFIGLIEKRE